LVLTDNNKDARAETREGRDVCAGRGRGIDLNSDAGIQERSRRRSGMCIQTALKMVNKDGMDEGGGLCSLCKGGCQDIPGMSLADLRQKRGGWEVAGATLDFSHMVRAPSTASSLSSSLLCSMLWNTEDWIRVRLDKIQSYSDQGIWVADCSLY
jgi:hypothetical protein